MGFRIAQVAELARQMTFTPTAKRAGQLEAAEQLLLEINPDKAYPFDFVIFRITEYHPKLNREDQGEDEFTGQLLTGQALQHDLGLLIESVADSLNLRAEDFGDRVLTIEQVADQHGVSKKTIQRSRRRGLPARRFIFPSGKRRFAFIAVNVDRFFNSLPTATAPDYSPIDAGESAVILNAVRRLANRGCHLEEITARIARRSARSPVAIKEIISRDEPALLDSVAPPLSEKEIRRIVPGVSIERMASRLGRPRSSVYQVLFDRRLNRLNRWNSKCIDDPLYHQHGAAKVIQQIVDAEELAAPAKSEDSRVPAGLSAALADICRTPLLTPGRERALFLKLNYHKFRFARLRAKLDPARTRWLDLNKLARHRRLALRTRNAIVAANMRLIISVARRHAGRAGDALMDLISDGGMTLMRAVDSFDSHRGTRFSTYATLALMKGFARGNPKSRQQARRQVDSTILSIVADARGPFPAERLAERDQVQQLMSRLDEREQAIVRAHYGLSPERLPATLEEVGRRLGISTHSVRLIEAAAMSKLRQVE